MSLLADCRRIEISVDLKLREAPSVSGDGGAEPIRCSASLGKHQLPRLYFFFEVHCICWCQGTGVSQTQSIQVSLPRGCCANLRQFYLLFQSLKFAAVRLVRDLQQGGFVLIFASDQANSLIQRRMASLDFFEHPVLDRECLLHTITWRNFKKHIAGAYAISRVR